MSNTGTETRKTPNTVEKGKKKKRGNNDDGQPQKELPRKRRLPAHGEAMIKELNKKYDDEYGIR